MLLSAGACPSDGGLIALLWLARSDPVPANAAAAQGLWQLGNCVLPKSAVPRIMQHLGEASSDVRQAAAAATAAALEVLTVALHGSCACVEQSCANAHMQGLWQLGTLVLLASAVPRIMQ